MGTPIKLDGSDGDIKEFTTSEENYLAYQIGLRLATAAKNTPASLNDIAQGGATTVGTYTDTSFDQPVGTHPESGITTTTTNTSLYQNPGSGTETGDNFKRPIHWNTDLTPDAIQEMTDTNFNACIDRLLSTVFTNDYPGTFELASSAPSGDYTAEISNIFTDTRTDGTTVNYSIFKRRTMTAPTTVRSIAIKRDDESTKPDNFAGLQEMTDAEISETFGERAKTRIIASLIGTYQLRSSADGVPTDPGTWVAKGTATDTRQEKGDVDYTRNSTITSVDSFAGDYTGDFTGNYVGEYAQDFVGDFTGNYVGNYIGAKSYLGGDTTYTGISTRTSLGPDAFIEGQTNDYLGNFTGNYIGPIDYVGIADYASTSTRNSTDTFTGNYSSTSTRNSTDDFVGNYGQDYVGDYTGNYAGSTILATNETIETYTLYVRTA